MHRVELGGEAKGGSRLRVLLLTHYFDPENGAPQRRWRALIERFVDAGLVVDVVAPPPHYPTGRAESGLPAELRAGGHAKGPHGGTVHRVAFLPHNASIVSRTLDHVWVARATVLAVMRLVRRGELHPDVLVATAPGLPTLFAGRVLAKRLGVPLIAEMRDAWPDLVSHTPGLEHGPAARAKRRVHEFVTGLQRDAALVVTTTESFAEVLRDRGIGAVEVIRNGTSLERYASIRPTEHDHDSLRVLYMGTVGRSQGLDNIIRASAIARERGVDLRTRIVGFGADFKRLQALNRSFGSPVQLLGRVEPRYVKGHYEWADTTVVSLRDWEPFRWTVPSKLYELMATGKHITAVVDGEAADIVRQSASGDVVAPGDANALADLWERLSSDRSLLDSRPSGRVWVADNADYDLIAGRYRSVLERVVRR